ncbi:MAG TPA: hypothetical protein VGG25_02650, partial [Streptosporangiaceae bacterium]
MLPSGGGQRGGRPLSPVTTGTVTAGAGRERGRLRTRLPDPVPAASTSVGRRVAAGRRPAGGPPRDWPVTGAEIRAVMQPGSRLPRTRRQVMRAFHADPRLANKRADFAAHLVDTVRELARYTAWDDYGRARGTCRPTRALIAARCGYSISTWRACRRQLEEWGWCCVVRQGRSEHARRMSREPSLCGYRGNDAMVLALTLPRYRRQKTAPVTRAPHAPGITRAPTSGAPRRSFPASPGDSATALERTALRAGSKPPKPARPYRRATGDGLEKLSDRAVAHAWRDFEGADWSMAAWRYAIHWRPDGAPHRRSLAESRFPAAALKWRLWLWRHPDT